MADTDNDLRPVFEIEDLRTLEVLTDPLRMRIVYMLITSGHTVREIADKLGLPVTRLYYHVNMLLDVGIIEVAETEKVGAMIQRRFRAVAEEYAPASSLLALIQGDRRMAGLFSALVLESARVDAEALLTSHRLDPDSPESKGVLGRASFRLDPERVEHWVARMTEVIEEIERESDENEAGELYGFTFVLAPLASPLREAPRDRRE